ncbi:hypothetical protein PFAG_01320 [Plasmodium falciparum Santa Lucia]|uniref:AP2 domain transcription factor, putative n=12 Tax=Plasmodium falciparum TaxID=5833 RepID=C6KSV7_PLAF7|nr:AP2 domain transcription factor, putative [Plasmodium falciparum 3D7]ETW19740.1 hypothetical protein PFFVO_01356 [Plasmodium falciparum Vietnam Oak-Knoll (FVO)]ETW37850.1 hypothetical protein PFTANZ_01422 [Plasmodium falciparum Tanzania (2000708)]ETW44210.1 hypothetical protein PFNF135_01461 [Plasmodium falciparum NF135/5.C10]ETW50652.1 hypothetical protein PFMALIP_01380 [Plasmodium falciparum MaliPS096_E11]ETW62856.1 hypothetical protein PFMC_01375 [Plasmodium falciparum CAMP/Malaysia]EUR|eukprot:XP_966101.1 transcription factor with AP2 domain(s),putative [Plasmodium falciparum 3D7]
MIRTFLINDNYFHKITYRNIKYSNNVEIFNIHFFNFVSCNLQTKNYGLIFFNNKRNFGVKRVIQKRKYMLKLIQPHQEQFDPEKYAKYLEQERMSEKVNINNINMDDEKQVELYENYLLNYKYNKRQVEKNGTLPLSLLSSSFIRRTIYSNREDVLKKLKNINWKKYCCNVKGVRWHASGAWRVYFCKRNYQHNFFVKCDCYFRVGIYGFEKSKELAVLYRKRLEYEYLLLMKRWKEIEVENAKKRKMIKESKQKDNYNLELDEDTQQMEEENYINEK